MKRNALRLLLSILVAFGIWVYVVTVVSPESEDTFYNIPVVLNNESVLSDKGLMVTSENDPTVTLRLRGNRSDLNNLKNSDISVVADLSKINEDGEQTLSYNVTYTGFGSGNPFEIVSQYPETITLEVTEWDSKEVPVNLTYSGTLDPEYIALKEELSLDYETVTLTGPKSVVAQISQAVIDIDLDNQYETISQSFRYTLCNEAGEPVDAAAIKTNVAEINVLLKIQQVKEIQLKVDVTYGGGATAQTSTVTMSDETIKVTGSEKLLEGLDSITVGSINLADFSADTVLIFPITLQEGITNLTGVSEVTVNIAFPDLVTKVLNVDTFYVSGLPAGMTYEIGAKLVSVTVRGSKEQMEAIESGNVSLIIDLSGAELGEDLYRAQVLFDTSFEGVGAIGTYTVLVTLTEKAGGLE